MPPPTLGLAAAELMNPMFDEAAMAKRAAELDEKRKERASQMKRGPGVAALVQAALQRAQTVPRSEKKEEEPKNAGKKAKLNVQEVDDDSDAEEAVEKRKQLREQEERERRLNELETETKAREKAERQAQEAQERERVERLARERRERLRQEEAEAETALQKREAETRDERIKASVEAAKRQQAERAAAKAAQEAIDNNLYSDMPQPSVESEQKMNEARAAAAEREKKNNLTNLPPEDRTKVVFLDVDGVLRPARAGGFDTLSVDGDARVDTSDFFPSAMKSLRHIIERTGAVIVLSSEWRRGEALCVALGEVFEKNRLRPWASATTSKLELEPGSDPVRQFADRRAREIAAWLDAHGKDVSGWAVLDDINIAIADESKKSQAKKARQEKDAISPHLVQTWPLCGLTMGNAKTAVRILNGEMINKVVVERPVAPTPSGMATPMPGKK